MIGTQELKFQKAATATFWQSLFLTYAKILNVFFRSEASNRAKNLQLISKFIPTAESAVRIKIKCPNYDVIF